MRRLFLCVVFGIGLVPGPAFGECAGHIEGHPRAGGGEYDPFDALDFRRHQTLTIRNTGAANCDFVVAFRRQPKEGRLGHALSYQIDDAAGLPLLTDQISFGIGSRYLIFSNVAASQAASTNYYLVVPRGQFVPSGVYHDNDVQLALYARGSSGDINFPEQHVEPLEIAQPVKASVNINIAGGGLHTTLNFDKLASGKERTVAIQAQANHSYSLVLRSENGSVLKLDTDAADGSAQIPYSLRVNAQPVALSSPITLRHPAPTLDWGQESHLLTFRIGDVADRRAGLYRDIVTIEISIAP